MTSRTLFVNVLIFNFFCLQAANKQVAQKKKAPPPPKNVEEEEESSEEDSDEEEVQHTFMYIILIWGNFPGPIYL